MKKLKSFFQSSIFKLLLELAVVFIGVFAAFYMNERAKKAEAKERQIQICEAIHAELESFSAGGRHEEYGFIQTGKIIAEILDSMVVHQEMPNPYIRFYGDNYQINIIKSVIESDGFHNMDLNTYWRINKFSVIHDNYMKLRDDFDFYYEHQILSEVDKGTAAFYDIETGKPNAKLKRLYEYADTMDDFAKSLVEFSDDLQEYIKKKYPEIKTEG